jgi:intracellular multiplication protein IcmP
MAKGQQERTDSNDPFLIAFCLLAVYAGIWALWEFGRIYIATAYGYFRYVEFWLFHALGSMTRLPGVTQLHDWIGQLCAPAGLAGPCQRDFSSVTWAEISDSTFYVNVGFAAVLIGYCIHLYIRAQKIHPMMKFTRRHDLMSFVKELMTATNPKDDKLLYPHLRMFHALNLIEVPLDDALFGMSLSSKQFVFQNRMVADWRDEGQNSWAPSIDRQRATQVFRKQLGNLWTSSAHLSPGETLLVAIAMPRVAATDPNLDDAKFKAAIAASDDMIRYCWQQFTPPSKKFRKKRTRRSKSPKADAEDLNAWLHPEIDLTRPRKVIEDYIRHKNVISIIQQHAYSRTVIFALFTTARRLGVLPPAEMRWLRFYDRPLWYVLQTIGRQAGFAEAAGVLSHYLYEAKAGVSIIEPQLDKAVDGIEAAIANFKFPETDMKLYQALTKCASSPVLQGGEG